nr:hypothetical protein [Microlunatus elymi]
MDRLSFDHLAEDAGDVVPATCCQRQLHEHVDSMIKIGMSDRLGDQGRRHQIGQTITGQQDPIAGGQIEQDQIRLRSLQMIDRPRDHRPVRKRFRVIGRELTGVQQHLQQAVVLGDLAAFTVPPEEGAGIADMSQPEALAVAQHRGQRGGHPVPGGVDVDTVTKVLMGEVDRLRQDGERVVLADHGNCAGDVRRTGRRHLTGRSSADAVGDQQQVGAGIAGVLIVRPDQPTVAGRGVPEPQHSNLSIRSDPLNPKASRQAPSGGAMGDTIVLGVRFARARRKLFAPVAKLGLIVAVRSASTSPDLTELAVRVVGRRGDVMPAPTQPGPARACQTLTTGAK